MKIRQISNISFFHGSYDKLPEGTILTPERGSFVYSQDKMDSHFKLEQFRPPEFLSRNHAVYMCTDIDDIDLSGGATDRVYLVVPLGKVEKHDLNWMTEIDLIISNASSDNAQEDEETIEKVKIAALNYWNGVPHYNESVWEYLTESAKMTLTIP